MTITCGNCNWYNPISTNHERGRCLLFDSIDPMKRDESSRMVNSTTPCRYDISPREQEGLTLRQIAGIVNKAPQTLRAKVTENDIRPLLV